MFFACSIFVGGSLLLKILLPNTHLIDFIASLIIGFLSEAASWYDLLPSFPIILSLTMHITFFIMCSYCKTPLTYFLGIHGINWWIKEREPEIKKKTSSVKDTDLLISAIIYSCFHHVFFWSNNTKWNFTHTYSDRQKIVLLYVWKFTLNALSYMTALK